MLSLGLFTGATVILPIEMALTDLRLKTWYGAKSSFGSVDAA